jgi:hypothetical protein
MPKTVKREQFRVDGDEVTHLPTNKKIRAYPGRASLAERLK